jgi:hypothetical protein
VLLAKQFGLIETNDDEENSADVYDELLQAYEAGDPVTHRRRNPAIPYRYESDLQRWKRLNGRDDTKPPGYYYDKYMGRPQQTAGEWMVEEEQRIKREMEMKSMNKTPSP